MTQFDGVDTNALYSSEGELDQIVEMLAPHKAIFAERMEIETADGNTLVISTDSGYNHIKIEEKDD